MGPVTIGGGAPISVQSMTKTLTEDVEATVRQIEELADVGCEIIRCAVPNARAAQAVGAVKKRSPIPVIADIHFQAHLAMAAIGQGVDGVRINPGNMRDKDGLKKVYRAARDRGIKVRIGVNSGSITPRTGMSADAAPDGEALAALMVKEALRSCEMAEGEGLRNIVLSLKASDVPTTIAACRLAAPQCDYPFHLGVTAAGTFECSIVKSAVGIGALLAEGIGDTVRVSITGPPHQEVKVAERILESLGLREPRGPQVISCPTCGRCTIDLEALVEQVAGRLEAAGKNVKVAVMGCVVNGPGEAADADVGIVGGKEFGYLFCGAQKPRKIEASRLVSALMEEVEKMP